MDDFSSKPGTPNIYGVVGSDANAIAPGKRPLSTMTPTILTSHGQVAVVIGTPGGSRIATSIFQVLTNWHDFHLPLSEAVAAARVHHQCCRPTPSSRSRMRASPQRCTRSSRHAAITSSIRATTATSRPSASTKTPRPRRCPIRADAAYRAYCPRTPESEGIADSRSAKQRQASGFAAAYHRCGLPLVS